MLGDIIVRYASLASTNDEAKARARFLPEGSVVTALTQTRGKGRLGRAWESEAEDGLYFSVILKPPFCASASRTPRGRPAFPPAPGNASSLALAAGVAVRRAIEEITSLVPLLKWPNDVFINGKKICGILLETSTAGAPGGAGLAEQGPDEQAVVCGIGVNVNNAGFSPDIAGKAASLFMEKGVRYGADEVLYAILRHFDAVYRLWLAEGFAALRDEYAANCVHFRGSREILVHRGGEALFSGYAEGLEDDGGLAVVVVRTDAEAASGNAGANCGNVGANCGNVGANCVRPHERLVITSGEVSVK